MPIIYLLTFHRCTRFSTLALHGDSGKIVREKFFQSNRKGPINFSHTRDHQKQDVGILAPLFGSTVRPKVAYDNDEKGRQPQQHAALYIVEGQRASLIERCHQLCGVQKNWTPVRTLNSKIATVFIYCISLAHPRRNRQLKYENSTASE